MPPGKDKARPLARPLWRPVRGRMGSSARTYGWGSSCMSSVVIFIADRDEHESYKEQYRECSTGADKIHHHRAILTRRRVIVVAVEHDLVSQIADVVLRCFDHPQAHVFRRVFDAVVILRHVTVRRDQDERTLV